MTASIFPTDPPFTNRLAPRADRTLLADDGTSNGSLLVSDVRGLVTTTLNTSTSLSVSHLGSMLEVNVSAADVVLTLPPSANLVDGDTIGFRLSVAGNKVQVTQSGTDLAWLSSVGDCVMTRWDGLTWKLLQWSLADRIDTYPSTGTFTWTKPPLASSIIIEGCGGGAGGGSGRRGAASTIRGGGCAGGHAAFLKYELKASLLGSSETVSVGHKGTGASAISVDDTNGSNGGSATASYVGNVFLAHQSFPGGGGTNVGGSTGLSWGGNLEGGHTNPTASSSTGGTASVPALNFQMANAGPGGGITNANVASAGTDAVRQACDTIGVRPTGGAATGAAGGDGATDTTRQWWFVGQPGAGGGANLSGAGGKGGNASGYGLGGGGGGASVNGSNSGAGGDGSDGYIQITTRF